MRITEPQVVIGLDVGGTCINATAMDERQNYLVDRMVEIPSCVQQGPDAAVAALAEAMNLVLEITGRQRDEVAAVGLDTPGPASADGVISSKGATNFSQEAWWGFDFRGALEKRLGIPVIYNNDGNAAALYAHHVHFKEHAVNRSSVAAIVGTGLGGGVVESGRVVSGAAGMAGELGHIVLPMDGLLGDGQSMPVCNCGLKGDGESVASLSGIENNLLPYWLSLFPDHELAKLDSLNRAAKAVRGFGERGDELALKVFEQQAMALGRLFSMAAMFTDPDVFFIGGGVVEAAPHFRDWFLGKIQENTVLRDEQRRTTSFALVPDLDMAGARGAAIAAQIIATRSSGRERAL